MITEQTQKELSRHVSGLYAGLKALLAEVEAYRDRRLSDSAPAAQARATIERFDRYIQEANRAPVIQPRTTTNTDLRREAMLEVEEEQRARFRAEQTRHAGHLGYGYGGAT